MIKKEKLGELLTLGAVTITTLPLTYLLVILIVKIESMFFCGSISECVIWGVTDITIVHFFINWFALLFFCIIFRKTSNSRYKAESRKAKKFIFPVIFLYLLTIYLTLNFLYIKTDSLGIYYKSKFLPWNEIKAVG